MNDAAEGNFEGHARPSSEAPKAKGEKGRSQGWNALRWSAVSQFNGRFGRQTVTIALQHLWEQKESADDPYALLLKTCESLAEVKA